MSNGSGDDGVASLKLAYEQIVQERDRLRTARAFFARQLGPLPAFGGISVAIVGAFSEKFNHSLFVWIAFAVLLVLIVVSMVFSGMPAYRHLRAENEDDWRQHLRTCFEDEAGEARKLGMRVEDMLSPRDWYIAQIQLERDLCYGSSRVPARRNRFLLPRWDAKNTNLQDLLDRERTGLFGAQFLFLVVIGLLLAARL